MKITELPKSFKQYFWEVDFTKIDPEKDAQYIIFRLLDKGNDKAISWLFKNYPKDLIKQVVKERRGFSAKKVSFWADILGVDKRKVVCLQKPYLEMRQEFWPY